MAETATKKKAEPELTIQEVAKRALDDAGGNIDTAAAMFEKAIRASERLKELLTEPLITRACRDAVMHQMREHRRTIWMSQTAPVRAAPTPPPQPDAKGQAERVVQLAAGTLLMFPLPGGRYLGDATRAEIAEVAVMYSQRATDAGHKARWLQLIAQSVPEGKTVKEALTDARLRELQAEAQNA